MQYWIARNNQKLGPYSLADVQRMMGDGKLLVTDLGWTQGMAAWGPVFDVIPAPQPLAPEPPPGPEALAPTRMVPVYQPPPEAGGAAASPSADPQQSPAANRAASIPTQQFQAPAQAQPQAFSAPVPQQQPAPAPAFTPQPAAVEPAPAPAASQPYQQSNQPYQQPGQSGQSGQPYQLPQPVQQFQPAPPSAQPFPAPPAAQPYQAPPAAQPYQAQPYPGQAGQPAQQQPYPGQSFQGQPQPAQPYPAQPYPPPGQPYQGQPNQVQPYPAQPYQGQAVPAGGVVPPGMHWALVLVLGSVTFGIFYIVWIIKQINFIKRIDPPNPAGKLIMLGVIMCVVYGVLVGAAIALQSSTVMVILGSLGFLIEIGASVCMIVAYFKMRASLLNYYNTVEPIGLRLSAAMTFFFNILYFQYHFHRIAEWKRTGMLAPQK